MILIVDDNGTLSLAETNSTESDELTEIFESIGLDITSLNETEDSNSTTVTPPKEDQSGL